MVNNFYPHDQGFTKEETSQIDQTMQKLRIRRLESWLKSISLWASVFIVILLLAIFVFARREELDPSEENLLASLTQAHAKMKNLMDLQKDPCNNFYEYACNGWLDKTELPPGNSRWSHGFDELNRRNNLLIIEILEAKWPIIGEFYDACKNLDFLQDLFRSPISPLILEYRSASTFPDLLNVLNYTENFLGLHLKFLFQLQPIIDNRNSSRIVISLEQNGYLLPDRTYYLTPSDLDFNTTVYKLWIERMFQTAGLSLSQLAIEDLYNLEYQLANISTSTNQQRQDELLTTIRTVPELRSMLGPDLFRYVEILSADFSFSEFNIGEIDYFTQLTSVTSDVSISTLRNYILLRLFYHSFPHLSTEFINLIYEFKDLTDGSVNSAVQNRTEYCSNLAIKFFPDLVGKYFVDAILDNRTKPDAEFLIDEIQTSFSNIISNSSWMDDVTKAEAILKLNAITNQIAYPPHWTDYYLLLQDFDIFMSQNHFTNYLSLSKLFRMRELNTSFYPVDPDQWYFTPATVNAGYSPNLNQITFPAGILQYPFFNSGNAMPANLGAIGVVMGHENTHGFDDQGRLFNSRGILQDWWSTNSAEEFLNRSRCVSNYYSTFMVDDTMHVNGNLTLGETLADLGGLHEAYKALERWVKNETSLLERRLITKVYGMNVYEIFFLSFAQIWCEKISPEYERQLAIQDPHPPAHCRVRGALAQFPPFSELYQCKTGDLYKAEEICNVW